MKNKLKIGAAIVFIVLIISLVLNIIQNTQISGLKNDLSRKQLQLDSKDNRILNLNSQINSLTGKDEFYGVWSVSQPEFVTDLPTHIIFTTGGTAIFILQQSQSITIEFYQKYRVEGNTIIFTPYPLGVHQGTNTTVTYSFGEPYSYYRVLNIYWGFSDSRTLTFTSMM